MAKTGRPRKTELEADGSIVLDLSLFWAHRALTRGVSHSDVADKLRVSASLIRKWSALGRPFRWAPLVEIISGESPTKEEPSVTIEVR